MSQTSDDSQKHILFGIIGLALLVLLGFGGVGWYAFQKKADQPTPLPTVILPSPAPTASATSLSPGRLPTRTPRFTPIPPNASAIDPNLPPAPPGFSWYLFPDLMLNILVPDGWHILQGVQDEADIFILSKDPADSSGNYSVGLTVKIYQNLEDVDAAAQELLGDMTQLTTTTRIVDSFKTQSPSAKILMYSVLFESEYYDLSPADANRKKRMVCTTIADLQTNRLYFMLFQSPLHLWEEEWNRHGGPASLSVINLLFARP